MKRGGGESSVPLEKRERERVVLVVTCPYEGTSNFE